MCSSLSSDRKHQISHYVSILESVTLSGDSIYISRLDTGRTNTLLNFSRTLDDQLSQWLTTHDELASAAEAPSL